MLVTVPRVSRSREHFPDGFDLHLPLVFVTYLTVLLRRPCRTGFQLKNSPLRVVNLSILVTADVTSPVTSLSVLVANVSRPDQYGNATLSRPNQQEYKDAWLFSSVVPTRRLPQVNDLISLIRFGYSNQFNQFWILTNVISVGYSPSSRWAAKASFPQVLGFDLDVTATQQPLKFVV